jgi:hypothetical protein
MLLWYSQRSSGCRFSYFNNVMAPFLTMSLFVLLRISRRYTNTPSAIGLFLEAIPSQLVLLSSLSKNFISPSFKSNISSTFQIAIVTYCSHSRDSCLCIDDHFFASNQFIDLDAFGFRFLLFLFKKEKQV